MTAIDPAIPGIWYGNFTGVSPFKINGLTSVSSYLFLHLHQLLRAPEQRNRATDRSQFYAPMVMDPSTPLRLYCGTQRIYQSNDGAGTWRAISPDLTGTGTGTITSIAVSPSLPVAVAIGTSTGKVQVSNTLTGSAVGRSKPAPCRYWFPIATATGKLGETAIDVMVPVPVPVKSGEIALHVPAPSLLW